MNNPDCPEGREPGRSSPAGAAGLAGPRAEPDFDPEHYPNADGPGLPAPVSERDDRIQAEFCAAYYRLNRLHAALKAVRAGGSAPNGKTERELLQEIEHQLKLRDQLEDQYTPLGVIAQPVVRDGFTVNLKFTFGDRTVFREQRTRLISSTALLFFGEPDANAAAVQRTPEEPGSDSA